MISNGEHKSKSTTVDLPLGYCTEQKQAIGIHTPGQRLEGESGISQKVCHQHGPIAGPAHKPQFTPKLFATALTQIPSHPWLSGLTSSPPLPHRFPCPASPRASEAFYYSPDNSLTSLFLSVLLISPTLLHTLPAPFEDTEENFSQNR